MPTLQVNGRTLHYAEQGQGTAVVLVHGFPLDGRVWQPVADRLASRGRVIVPDLRGFGRNPPEQAFTLVELADDIAQLMQTLGVAPCPVAGLSMGGYVVQALAKAYPGIASRVILVDTKAAADTEDAKQKRDAMADLAVAGGAKAVTEKMLPDMTAPGVTAETVAALRAIMETQSPQTLAAGCRAMRDRDDFVAFLPTVESPIDFIFGAQDAISPAAAVEPLVGGLRQGRLTIIDAAGHMAPFEQPQAVADAIGSFLS